ncbi:phage head spike fiber domain-containing protein [Pseudomonas citronellolis]|uniref:phage head spike fiber domain-containing protein n=1 Tax=Pseudomonas citronellolis TaxID=53408 RepID=UPI003AAE665A
MGAALKPLLKRVAVGSPAALPTLDLDFLAQSYKVSDGAGGMNSVAFADLVAFTRSGAAWRFNASGVLEQVAANQPRFDYDPVTLALRGLLIEEQRTNLATYSDDFSNSAWVKGTLTTVSSSAVVSPTGGTMQKLIETTENDLHSVYQSKTVAVSTAYALSFHMKQGERRYVALTIGTSRTQSAVAVFDLQAGAVVRTYTAGNTFVFTAAGIINCGNGIYRPWVSATTPSSGTSAIPAIWLIPDSLVNTNIPTYTGDGTSGAYVWGGQFEAGAFPTSYIPTTSSQVTRAADVASVNMLSPWYNPAAGAVYAEWDASGGLATNSPVWVLQGSGTNIIRQRAEAARPLFDVYTDGVAQASISVGAPVVAGVTRKTAAAWMLNSFQAAADGSLGAPDVSGSIPSVTQLAFVKANVTAASFNGHIRRVRYWPRRLFDNELQRITA